MTDNHFSRRSIGMERLDNLTDKVRLFLFFAENCENELNSLRSMIGELARERKTLAECNANLVQQVEKLSREQQDWQCKTDNLINALGTLLYEDVKEISAE